MLATAVVLTALQAVALFLPVPGFLFGLLEFTFSVTGYLLIAGIGALAVGAVWELLQKSKERIPPLSKKGYWLKRVIIDTTIVQLVAGIVSIPLFIALLEPFEDLLISSNPLDPTQLASILTPEVFALSGAVLQVSMLLVLFWRQFTNAIPASAFRFEWNGIAAFLRAVIGYGLLLYGVSALIDYLLSSAGIALPPQFILDTESLTIHGIGGMLLFGVIGAPFVEELFFRGYLLTILQGRGNLFALIVSSLIFGLIHLQPAYMLYLSVTGFVLGFAYLRTRNLLVPMTIHALNNFIAFYFTLNP